MTSIVGTAGDDVIYAPSASPTGAIVDASSNASGVPGANTDARAGEPQLLSFSPDGQEIAFTLGGTGLVPGVDTSAYATEVFVKNLSTGAISLVSSDASGTPINVAYGAETPVFSADGSAVFFRSNYDGQIYEKNLATASLSLESATQAGVAGDASSYAVAATSTQLFFQSASDNLAAGASTPGWRLYVKNIANGDVTAIPNTENGSDYTVSADGLKVAFLNIDDQQVYVEDLVAGTLSRVSTSASGIQANYICSSPTISPDGTKVAFETFAQNLVPGGGSGFGDVYVKDLTTGAVTRESTSSSGGLANSSSADPSFSPDGSKLVFTSSASSLVASDTNSTNDVFVKDLNTGAIALVSTSATGAQASGQDWYPVFSPDGNHVAFLDDGPLVSGAAAGGLQVYVKDLAGGQTDIDGAGGINTISYANVAHGVTVSLALQGQAQDTGGGAIQTLHNFQNLTGSPSNDTLEGDSGNNVLDGGGGTNTVSYAHATAGVTVSLALQGQAQNTIGAGSDTLTNFQGLTGSAYNDVLTAGGGASILTGGLGADTFKIPVSATAVTITDFSAAQGDKIDLSAFGQLFSLAAVLASSTQSGPNTVISTGSGSVVLSGVQKSSLVASDFLLASPPAAPNHGLHINVTYDSSVDAAPAGFRAAVQAAVQFFETTFDSNASVNIDVGWGELGGDAVGANAVGESSFLYKDNFTYAQVHSALALTDAWSPTAYQAVAGLPNYDPTYGGDFALTSAEAKALGLYDGPSSVVDGYVGLSSADTFTFDPNNRAVPGAYDGVGVIEHEISEILGRVAFLGSRSDYGALDLFRYGSPNVHSFAPGQDFFSLDGSTALKWFNSGSNGDAGDWASSGQADAFDAFAHLGTEADISAADEQVLQVLGYAASPGSMLSGGPTVGPGLGGTAIMGSATGGPINGTPGNDWLQGGSSNDTLHGGAGSDYLDGGAGVNTAAYDGVFEQYVVGTGGLTVSCGPEGGTDVLANIQRVLFTDGYLAFSPTDTAGQVYRVYEATLDRAPDPEGLANWVSALNSGTSLQSVVDGFVNSTEFQQTYGALDNTGFVSLLYENVLHRAPDAAGLQNWVNALNGGESRAQVVTGFSESQEDIAALAAPVQQGLWVESTQAAEVTRLYDTVLGRLPDAAGLANWAHQMQGGMSLQAVADGFTGSAEFQTRYGSLDNTGFVSLLYENVLHRPADTAGLNNWLNALNGGETRAQVVVGFSESAEHIANTAAHIDYGVWVA